jgi:hypothetical protein
MGPDCAWSQFCSTGYLRVPPRTFTGTSASSMVYPWGFGKLCQLHCDWVSSGTSGEYCSWKVCSPVMSAVKAMLPLPTIKGAAGSTWVSVGL